MLESLSLLVRGKSLVAFLEFAVLVALHVAEVIIERVAECLKLVLDVIVVHIDFIEVVLELLVVSGQVFVGKLKLLDLLGVLLGLPVMHLEVVLVASLSL